MPESLFNSRDIRAAGQQPRGMRVTQAMNLHTVAEPGRLPRG